MFTKRRWSHSIENDYYYADPLEGKTGIASDYGRQYLNIGRVPEPDAILYQTERYHHSNFGYDIPVGEDGDYVLVLKFCEVYFNSPSMKVCFSPLIVCSIFFMMNGFFHRSLMSR